MVRRPLVSRPRVSILASRATRLASTASMVARFCERISSSRTPSPRTPLTTLRGDARVFFLLAIGAPVYSTRAIAHAKRGGCSRGGTAVVAAMGTVAARTAKTGPEPDGTAAHPWDGRGCAPGGRHRRRRRDGNDWRFTRRLRLDRPSPPRNHQRERAAG